jgi:hypothetical protein
MSELRDICVKIERRNGFVKVFVWEKKYTLIEGIREVEKYFEDIRDT